MSRNRTRRLPLALRACCRWYGCLRAPFDCFCLTDVGGSISFNIGIRNPTSGQVVTALTGAFALDYIADQDRPTEVLGVKFRFK